jgi:type VI secretion system secreted protein VgrG
MPNFPASRFTDMHICPMVTPAPVPVPHVGGPVIGPCAPTVLIGMLLAARITDMAMCVGPPDTIVKGSATVLTMKLLQARVMDNCAHGGMLVMGCFTVLVGEQGPSPGLSPAMATLMASIAMGQPPITIGGDAAFQEATLMALSKLALTPTGEGLLASLAASGRTTNIVPTAGGNSQSDNGPGGYQNADGTPGAGCDTTVSWNPNRTVVPPGTEPWQTRDPAIGLGHELIHADHATHGNNENGSSNYNDLNGNPRNANNDEQQAVGLNGKGGPYTENGLRRDFDNQNLGSNGTQGQRPYY